MSIFSELQYNYKVTKELFTIKSRFENEMDEEGYYYETKINKYINFSDDGEFFFSNQNVKSWSFHLEPNKRSMVLYLKYAFDNQNEWLTDLYGIFLAKEGLIPEQSRLKPLEWRKTDDIVITDGLNNITPWLKGNLDNNSFLKNFNCPTPINPEYDCFFKILSNMDSDELLSNFLNAKIGNESKDLIPYDIILAFEKLEQWIQKNQ